MINLYLKKIVDTSWAARVRRVIALSCKKCHINVTCIHNMSLLVTTLIDTHFFSFEYLYQKSKYVFLLN